jgi:hypothetical protein
MRGTGKSVVCSSPFPAGPFTPTDAKRACSDGWALQEYLRFAITPLIVAITVFRTRSTEFWDGNLRPE